MLIVFGVYGVLSACGLKPHYHIKRRIFNVHFGQFEHILASPEILFAMDFNKPVNCKYTDGRAVLACGLNMVHNLFIRRRKLNEKAEEFLIMDGWIRTAV